LGQGPERASYTSDGNIIIFSKMLLLWDVFKTDNGVDEESLVKNKKVFIEKMCLIVIRTGSETFVVYCGWKTITYDK